MQVYDLADAVVAGDLRRRCGWPRRSARARTGPRGCSTRSSAACATCTAATELLDAGVPEQKVAGAMKMAPWQAKRTLAQAKKADRDSLARAICVFADLEMDLRGAGELDEDTAFSLALAKAAA